jgi:TolA-binding protein
MLTKKKKLSKKAIKEDKLIELYYRVYGYIQDNTSKVLTYGGVIVVLFLGIIYYVYHKKEENTKANIALSKVLDSYQQGAYLEAIEGKAGTDNIGLKKIVEEYGGTENGETAKIYLANAYSRLGKAEDAFKYYKDYDGDINIFQATALAGQAGYYASKNDYQKAAELYEKASNITKEDVLNPDYTLYAGINYLNAGNDDKAKEMFDKIKNDYENSSAAREVNRYIAEVE